MDIVQHTGTTVLLLLYIRNVCLLKVCYAGTIRWQWKKPTWDVWRETTDWENGHGKFSEVYGNPVLRVP
jgi:hypothetical protein